MHDLTLGRTTNDWGFIRLRTSDYADSNTEEEFREVINSEADMVNLDKPELYIEILQEEQQ